ncbi:MAG: Uma2 family endonuclease [Bryobacteraceae bacterium]|nr:Uma2 family endonuclease [Bryobacteraceae bacterium]
MAPTTELVSVAEYLAAETKPAREYEDGVVTQKPMPTRKHGLIQGWLVELLRREAPEWEPGSEVTVQVRTGKFLVPDLIAQRRDLIQDPYPTEPVALCVEILSPSDRLSDALAKCEAYLAWGVADTWILDPDQRCAWTYSAGDRLREVPAGGSLRAQGVSIPLATVFQPLDGSAPGRG